jgi:hypothetical protein
MFTIKGKDYCERRPKNELLLYLYSLQKSPEHGGQILHFEKCILGSGEILAIITSY